MDTSPIPYQRTDRPMPTDSVQMLCWMFQRRNNAVTCEVDFDARHPAYEVYVTPPRGSSGVHVERFDRAAGALQRHAQIVAQLRQAGWTLAGYGHQRRARINRNSSLLRSAVCRFSAQKRH